MGETTVHKYSGVGCNGKAGEMERYFLELLKVVKIDKLLISLML